MSSEAIVVLITVPSRQTGMEIAGKLVEKRLAACVNLLGPIQSVFRWQGQIEQEEELLLVVKTQRQLFASQLVPAVQEMHPYKVPEIIALPIEMGAVNYLNWIAAETQPGGREP
jgi:periplasmic divalent cation tolerance protein